MEPINGAERPAPEPDQGRVSTDTLLLIALGLVAAISLLALVLGWVVLERTTQTDDDLADLSRQVADVRADSVVDDAPGAEVFETIVSSLVVVEAETAEDGDLGSGLGAGVVIARSGEIVTAVHVVGAAERITITYADGTESPAVVSARDESSDVALLRPAVFPASIPAAPLGAVSMVDVGDPVFVVGHALGLRSSLTGGIVSGLDRDVPIGDLHSGGLIQFDAAVNPGNSGGPLVDADARVIGIVTALASPIGGPPGDGVGFAVPIDRVLALAGEPGS